MKDGRYALRFSANGYQGSGHVDVDGSKLVGGDGAYRLEGSLQDGRQHVTGSFNVTLEPTAVANARVPRQFSLQMSGTASEYDFSLLGIGPLGLIVEMVGAYGGRSV